MFAPANVHVGRSGTKTTNLKSGEEVVDIGTLLYKLTLLAINRDLIMCDLDAWIVNLGKAMKISIQDSDEAEKATWRKAEVMLEANVLHVDKGEKLSLFSVKRQ